MSEKLTIGRHTTVTANLIAIDDNSQPRQFVYASCFAYASAMKEISRELGKKCEISACYKRYTAEPKKYKLITSAVPDTDYQHAIIARQDSVAKDVFGVEQMQAYIFIESDGASMPSVEYMSAQTYPDKLIDAVWDKFEKLVPYLVLREWVPEIIAYMAANGQIVTCNVMGQETEEKKYLNVYSINTPVDDPRSFISSQLECGRFSINDSNMVSPQMKAIRTMDPYLNTFSVQLAEEIKDSFRPYFRPGADEYDNVLKDLADYAEYTGDLTLYPAQKAVIQACSNALDKSKCVFMIGEQGSGKTAMTIDTALLNNKDKPGMTNFVLCPGHLVNKWKKEIGRMAPNSDAVIVENFHDFLQIKGKMLDKKRRRHLWLIVSKERAKLGYDERPAAVWKESARRPSNDPTIPGMLFHDGVFVCPKCGKPLYSVRYEGKGRSRFQVREYFDKSSFASMNASNMKCMNTVLKYDRGTGKMKEVECGAKLWEANNGQSEWIQLENSQGWILRKHVEKEYVRLQSKTQRNRKEEAFFAALASVVENEEEPQQRHFRRFPIAKYILRYMKGSIDYLVCDEVKMGLPIQ